MTTLAFSKDLRLPLDAVTQKIAFLGRTGSGKTYAATKLFEEFFVHDAQCIALDPVGVWWGLRLPKDGKGKGLDVPVFGGLHGDVPIEPTGAGLLADLIVDRGISCVLDVSQFEFEADKARFARDFADRFFFRKKAKPSAVHVFVEEAQEFLPQNPQGDEARMLHSWTRLIKLGRNYGIGVSLISQRPQEVSKKALNQTELLLAFQLTGPQERKTLKGWVAEKGLDVDLVESLPALKVGHAHAWSPSWLEFNDEIAISEKLTFAAGSTPKVGARAVVPKPLRPIELEEIRVAMAATIERAKQEDPRELRKRIVQLEAAVKLTTKTAKRVEVPVLTKRQEALLSKLEGKVAALRGAARSLGDDIEKTVAEIRKKIPRDDTHEYKFDGRSPSLPTPTLHFGKTLRPNADAVARGHDGSLTATQSEILETIAMLNARGIDANRISVARWRGIHPNGGRYLQDLARLRETGKLEGMRLLVNVQEHAVTGEAAAFETVRRHDRSRSEVLQAIATGNGGVSRVDLAAKLGIHPNGGRFLQNLARLREMGLITERSPIEVTEGFNR